MTATNSNCCYLTSEYLDLGVTFETTDDGSVWGGLSNGNPGTWGLEGTNGPAFLGFNGASYSATMLFDVPVSEFSLDMAPSGGWSMAEDLFTLEGYLDGALVDQVSLPPLGFATWMTVALAGEIDEVTLFASGPSGRYAFGVDNVNWTPVVDIPGDIEDPVEPTDPEVHMIEIDVEPTKKHHHMNLFHRRSTRVALLGSEVFEVDRVDVESLMMGPDSAPSRRAHVKDINKDGLPDLLVSFRTRALGLAYGDNEICLSGAMLDGEQFEGCDSIQTMPPHAHKRHHKHRSHKKK
jgi:hypothetical protein